MLDYERLKPFGSGEVSTFRQLKVGPEAVLQSSVEMNIAELLPASIDYCWTGSAVPIGAGVPDLLRASVQREAIKLTDADSMLLAILGYLRAAGRARLETIAERLGLNEQSTRNKLDLLHASDVIEQTRKTFHLAQPWQNILGDVSAIEVKVSDWKRAVAQASRNKIFAHRSFVALPESVAKRVKGELCFSTLGLGIIAISDDGSARIIRRARKSPPKAWVYYYTVAARAARDLKDLDHGVPS